MTKLVGRAMSLFLVVAPLVAFGQGLQSSPVEVPQSCSIVQVFGDANVRSVVSSASDATNATGSIGMRYYGPSWVAVGSISIAGPSDTLTNSFGSTLLPPASGRAFNAGLIDLRLRQLPYLGQYRYLTHVGFRVYGSASSSIWALEDTIQSSDHGPIPPQAFEVPVWGMGAGLYYQFFGGSINDSNYVAMLLDVGWAKRNLRGDLFSDGRKELGREEVRLALLGSSERAYSGLELGLSMVFNGLKAGMTYYYFGRGNKPHVDGLTGGQVVAGIGIQTTLASDWLRSSIAAARRARSPRDTLSATADSIGRAATRLEERALIERRRVDSVAGAERESLLQDIERIGSASRALRIQEANLRDSSRAARARLSDPVECARRRNEAPVAPEASALSTGPNNQQSQGSANLRVHKQTGTREPSYAVGRQERANTANALTVSRVH